MEAMIMSWGLGSAFMCGFTPVAAAALSLGPQNIFVLRHGLSRQSALVVIGVCFGCDIGLISFAVLGLGAAVDAIPLIALLLRKAGSVYLLLMAARTLVSGFRGGIAHSTGERAVVLRQTILGAVCVSLLNPLAWIETALVLGALSSTVRLGLLATFTAGAVIGSFVKFTTLGLGAQVLAPLLVRPAFCRGFDVIAGMTMVSMAAVLL